MARQERSIVMEVKGYDIDVGKDIGALVTITVDEDNLKSALIRHAFGDDLGGMTGHPDYWRILSVSNARDGGTGLQVSLAYDPDELIPLDDMPDISYNAGPDKVLLTDEEEEEGGASDPVVDITDNDIPPGMWLSEDQEIMRYRDKTYKAIEEGTPTDQCKRCDFEGCGCADVGVSFCSTMSRRDGKNIFWRTAKTPEDLKTVDGCGGPLPPNQVEVNGVLYEEVEVSGIMGLTYRCGLCIIDNRDSNAVCAEMPPCSSNFREDGKSVYFRAVNPDPDYHKPELCPWAIATGGEDHNGDKRHLCLEQHRIICQGRVYTPVSYVPERGDAIRCDGCAFHTEYGALGAMCSRAPCESHERDDGDEVIWICEDKLTLYLVWAERDDVWHKEHGIPRPTVEELFGWSEEAALAYINHYTLAGDGTDEKKVDDDDDDDEYW